MFLIDANILIEAKNRYYQPSIAPGFWDWLTATEQNFRVRSVAAVGRELAKGGDILAKWATGNPWFFCELDNAAVAQQGKLAQWSRSQNYSEQAIAEFNASFADFQLVAYASAHNAVVVTNEKSSPNSKKRIKIPDACDAVGVRYMNLFDVLLSENVVLDLRIVA